MTKTALALRHLKQEHLGHFAPVLENLGFDVRYVDVALEDFTDQDVLDSDLVFVLGGPLGVYQAPHYPFLSKEVSAIEKRLEQEKPTFGICLGAQIMAAALGAKVYPGSNGKEVGWKELNWDLDLSSDTHQAFTPLTQTGVAFKHWHGDTFDLPKDAELLASTDQYPHQVFTYKNSVGFQCHPEVTPQQLKEWLVLFVGHITGDKAVADIEQIRADTLKYAPAIESAGQQFLKNWINTVMGEGDA